MTKIAQASLAGTVLRVADIPSVCRHPTESPAIGATDLEGIGALHPLRLLLPVHRPSVGCHPDFSALHAVIPAIQTQSCGLNFLE